MAIIGSLPFTLVNGTTADATQVMADFNTIVSNVNANAAGNGANSDITSLNALTTPLSAASGGSQLFTAAAPSTGAANAQIIALLSPTGFTLTAGFRVSVINGFTNTGALTLAVNGLTATAVLVRAAAGLQALQGGEVVVNQVSTYEFDGTQFELLDPTPQEGSWTPVIAGSTIAGTQSYAANGQVGRYIREKNLVTFWGRVTMTAKDGTSAGNMQLQGLPFPSSNITGLSSTIVVFYQNITFTGTQLVALLAPGASLMTLQQLASASVALSLPMSGIANNADIAVSGSYRIG